MNTKELREEYCEKHGYIDAVHINHRVYSEWLEQRINELTQPQQTVSDDGFLDACNEVRQDFAKYVRGNYSEIEHRELRTQIDTLIIMYDQMRDKLQQPTEKIELINRLNLATHEGDYTTQMYDEDLEMIEKIQSQPHSVDRDRELIELCKQIYMEWNNWQLEPKNFKDAPRLYNLFDRLKASLESADLDAYKLECADNVINELQRQTNEGELIEFALQKRFIRWVSDKGIGELLREYKANEVDNGLDLADDV